MTIIGGVEDNLAMLVWARVSEPFFKITSAGALDQSAIYRDMFFSYVHPWLNNQALFAILVSVLLTAFGIWGYYILLSLTFILNFVVSYSFFKPRSYAIYFAIIFSLSSYVWLQFGNHVDLMQIWLIPWVLSSIKNDSFLKSVRNQFFVAGKILVAVLISNYLGFAAAAVYFGYVLLSFFRKKIDFKKLLVSIISPMVLVLVVLFPYIKTNYLQQNDTPIDFTQPLVLHRPIEDFVTFSSRPWYFFIPHHNNFIYVGFSTKLVNKIESSGYFLADDYFAAEHAAAFYGYLLTAAILFCSFFGLFKLPSEKKNKVTEYLLLAFILFLVSLPPFFTLGGVTVYTPGFLVFKFFPMFRVTARFSIIILFLLLLVSSEVITFLSVSHKRFFKVFMPILLIVTLLETFVVPKIQSFDVPPEPYEYMSTKTPMSMDFMVYPYSESNKAFFWLPLHKQHLYNVRGYSFKDISAEELTKNMLSAEGVLDAKKRGVEYVLVFDSNLNVRYFNNASFQLVEIFSDAVLYKIN